MKKQKENKERRNDTILVILIAILIIAIILVAQFIYLKSIEEHYKIYKTECKNESKLIYYVNHIQNFDHHINVSYNYYEMPILSYLKVEEDMRKEIAKSQKYICNWQEDNLEVIWHNDTAVTYSLDYIELWDCYDMVEECKDVRVEEKSLSKAWDICWKDGISEKEFVTCSLMEEGKFDWGEYPELGELFLDERCECAILMCPEGWYQSNDENLCTTSMWNIGDNYKKKECLEYKCLDKYKVIKQ